MGRELNDAPQVVGVMLITILFGLLLDRFLFGLFENTLRKRRGLSKEDSIALVVNGFVKDVLQQLPMEFAVEAQKLISISLEGSVG